jgi:phospholipid transport system substrate-binding protein
VRKAFFSFLPGALALCVLGITPAYAMDNSTGQRAEMPPGLVAPVSQDMVAGAKNFIQSMAQRGIDFLGNEKLNAVQRKEEFRKLLRSSYDLKTIGRFALGTYWRTATPKQQEEYQRLFEKMVVNVYANRFSEYKGQQLEVRNARMEGESDVIVNSVILPVGSGDDIAVDWRVRKKGGQYRVIDVIVAGVSMALTQRSDFASVIQRGGGDVNVLLEHLRGSRKE